MEKSYVLRIRRVWCVWSCLRCQRTVSCLWRVEKTCPSLHYKVLCALHALGTVRNVGWEGQYTLQAIFSIGGQELAACLVFSHGAHQGIVRYAPCRCDPDLQCCTRTALVRADNTFLEETKPWQLL